jgi:hypothetical protein
MRCVFVRNHFTCQLNYVRKKMFPTAQELSLSGALSNEYIIKLYSTTWTCVTRYQVDTLWIYGKFHAFRRATTTTMIPRASTEERARRNLINFETQAAGEAEKVLNRLIFSHKTFHIFQSSCLCDDAGRRPKEIWGEFDGWTARRHRRRNEKKTKNVEAKNDIK